MNDFLSLTVLVEGHRPVNALTQRSDSLMIFTIQLEVNVVVEFKVTIYVNYVWLFNN